jgi:purine-nucleoside phosphorylase
MSGDEFDFPDSLRKHRPAVGLVLGSGLGGFVERVDVRESIDYGEIRGLPVSGVEGHSGRFVFGELGGVPLVIAQGRVHVYEGWSARETAAHVRLMAHWGIETLLLTNAAGIVNPELRPGQWMQIRDHLNLTGQSPLTGGAHFVDQTGLWSARLRRVFREQSPGGELAEGIYAWVPGPEYETPAQVRMLRTLGADAVGMSTVPEAIQARALGLEIAGFCCLTNYGAGLSDASVNHQEVLAAARIAAHLLANLLDSTLGKLRIHTNGP